MPPTDATPTRAARLTTRSPLLPLAVALDAACVVGFATAGRASHEGVGGAAGVLGTAWPFLVAGAVGWLVLRAWRAPARLWPTGVGVWAFTWAAGLGLRGLAGGGLAVPFVVVAAVVLAVTLLGWRAVAMAVSRSARRRRAGSARARQPGRAPGTPAPGARWRSSPPR